VAAHFEVARFASPFLDAGLDAIGVGAAQPNHGTPRSIGASTPIIWPRRSDVAATLAVLAFLQRSGTASICP